MTSNLSQVKSSQCKSSQGCPFSRPYPAICLPRRMWTFLSGQVKYVDGFIYTK